jgi:hypothetical protein
MRLRTFKSHTKNNGSTLAIALTILTAITLISVTSLQRSGIQGRMVGNIQHQEQGFHAANGELEEIYQFYATQPSATQALSTPLNSFDIISGEQIFKPIEPGHESSYNAYSIPTSDQSHSQATRLSVASDIQHTGLKNSLVEGFSVGSFVEYDFTVTSKSTEPSFDLTPGRTLSSQLMGIKFIAPAS